MYLCLHETPVAKCGQEWNLFPKILHLMLWKVLWILWLCGSTTRFLDRLYFSLPAEEVMEGSGGDDPPTRLRPDLRLRLVLLLLLGFPDPPRSLRSPSHTPHVGGILEDSDRSHLCL